MVPLLLHSSVSVIVHSVLILGGNWYSHVLYVSFQIMHVHVYMVMFPCMALGLLVE